MVELAKKLRQAAEDARGREHAAEAVLADAMLDNAALKDLLGKKW